MTHPIPAARDGREPTLLQFTVKRFSASVLPYVAWALVGLSACRKEAETGVVPQLPAAATFRNPILPSGPDPWVIRQDGYYYYTSTAGNRLVIRKTPALSRLGEAEAKTVWTPPATGPNAQHLWAPELHFLDGKWYVYYTAGAGVGLETQRTWVLENPAADPTTSVWTDKGKIAHPTEDYWAIDGTVFEQKGVRYFLWSGYATPADVTQRIYIARMSNPWTLTGPRTQLSAPDYGWETAGYPDVNEGPQILEHDNSRCLVYSAGGCWTDDYALGVLTMNRADDPLDAAAWTKSATPVFTKNPEGGAYGPGHCSFFQSPDGTEDWILYHANPRAGLDCGDFRSPRMQPFTWRADGTPDFGRPVPINTAIRRPAGES